MATSTYRGGEMENTMASVERTQPGAWTNRVLRVGCLAVLAGTLVLTSGCAAAERAAALHDTTIRSAEAGAAELREAYRRQAVGNWRTQAIGAEVGELYTETRAVEAVGAEAVSVLLQIGVGDLAVVGGDDRLLTADFAYNVSRWRPQIEYKLEGTQGNLHLSQPEADLHGDLRRARNEWDLRLGSDLPLDLAVRAGIGRTELVLGGLPLTGLDVEMGVGELTVDLTGDWSRSLDATITGGIGRAIVKLPADVGVRVDANGSLGSIEAKGLNRQGNYWINDAYGQSPVTLDIKVEAGVGQILLQCGE